MSIPIVTEKEFQDLISAMKHPVTGFVLEDRKHHLKSYKDCFIASEAVSWLAQYLSCTRPLATRIAVYCQKRGYIDHILSQNIFKDSHLIFHFTEPHTDGQDWSLELRKYLFRRKSSAFFNIFRNSGVLSPLVIPPPRKTTKIFASITVSGMFPLLQY
jgi:hypothetical protein